MLCMPPVSAATHLSQPPALSGSACALARPAALSTCWRVRGISARFWDIKTTRVIGGRTRALLRLLGDTPAWPALCADYAAVTLVFFGAGDSMPACRLWAWRAGDAWRRVLYAQTGDAVLWRALRRRCA